METLVLSASTVAAPWGEVRVVEGSRGVVCVELLTSPLTSTKRRLERALGQAVELRQQRTGAAARQISEYLAGKRRKFEVSIDFCLVTGFAQNVLRSLVRVPYGEVTSYGALAARAGNPGAARAVGGVMRKNPLPLIAPCHRVIASDGSLGGFTGGLGIKRTLLALEGRSL